MSNSSTINVDIVVNDNGATASVKKFGQAVDTAGNTGAKSMASLRTGSESAGLTLGSLVKSAAVVTTTFFGMQAAVTAVFDEFVRGLKSIEDFNLGVASSAAFITTFSEKTRSGDLAGGFREANEYAKALNAKLEIMDSQTIASGKDLQIMSETMLQYGVVLDINNQKQVSGFTNIATALALVTQGQNKDIQMRQEINALLMGQVRATDRLPKLLSAIDPHLQEHLVLWKKEGTLIENVGELLKGFATSTGDLDDLWITVGSTMETIHNRVLRGAFKPIFEDLIGLAKDINKSLMDAEGNLTPIAKGIQEDISSGYKTAKELAKEYGGGLVELAGYLVAAKVAQIAVNAAVNANPYVLAASGLALLNQSMKDWSETAGVSEDQSLAITSLDDKYRAFTGTIGKLVDVWKGIRDPNTGKVLSEQERTLARIAELEGQLTAGGGWSIFGANEDQRVAAVNTELVNLKTYLNDIDELSRKNGESSASLVTVPTISSMGADDLKSQIEILKEYKKEVDEQKAAEKEMYTEAGLGAEQYFSREATSLVEKAARWEKAGANTLKVEQYLYDQLGTLSAEAYAKEEFTAGRSMDTLQAMSRTVVDQFNSANGSISGILESMGIKVDELNGKEIGLSASFDGSSVITGVDALIAKFAELRAAASAAPTAPTSNYENTDPSKSAQQVADEQNRWNNGNSSTDNLTININQQLSRSDVNNIINEQKRIGARA